MGSAARRSLAAACACLALTTDLVAQTPTGAAAPAPAPATAPHPGPAASGAAPSVPRAAAPGASAPGAAAARPSPLNPTPAEFPSTTLAPSTPQLDALLSRVAALRSRIAALASALFSSKLRIEVRAGGDGVRLESLHVSLDGGVVYTAPPRSGFEQTETVYEHPVAPGQHVIGIAVERHDTHNPQVSSGQESRFVVLVPEKKLLWTRLELEDESTMAEDFTADNEGKYQLRVKLIAEVNE